MIFYATFRYIGTQFLDFVHHPGHLTLAITNSVKYNCTLIVAKSSMLNCKIVQSVHDFCTAHTFMCLILPPVSLLS